MSHLIPCIDCGVELSRDVLRAHLAQDHKVWRCRVCHETIRHAIGALDVPRLTVCSWFCLVAGRDSGHCRRCLAAPGPGFAQGCCPSCAPFFPVLQGSFLPEESLASDDEPEPEELADWLPPHYRRSGWKLDRSPLDDEEEAA